MSIDRFLSDIDSLLKKEAKVEDFCFMIINTYIIRQHHRVATEKLLGYKLETFCIIENDEVLEYRSKYSPNFNQFRGFQGVG